jgi:hypothetical protein
MVKAKHKSKNIGFCTLDGAKCINPIYGPKKSYDTISNINVLFNQTILNLVPPFKNTFYFCLKFNFISLKTVKLLKRMYNPPLVFVVKPPLIPINEDYKWRLLSEILT